MTHLGNFYYLCLYRITLNIESYYDQMFQRTVEFVSDIEINGAILEENLLQKLRFTQKIPIYFYLIMISLKSIMFVFLNPIDILAMVAPVEADPYSLKISTNLRS